MTTDEVILIISTAVDAATDEVVRILGERGARVVRINSEDLPFEGFLNIDYRDSQATSLDFSGRKVCPQSVWYRRLRTPPKPEPMDDGIYDFCLRENRAALLGGLLTQQVRWMSHPGAVWQAEFKPYQLHVAQAVGLAIPPTLVSNDPSAIARAHAQLGDMIVKPVKSGYFLQGGEEYAVFTSLLTPEHLNSLEDAKWAPSIYQQRVPKEVDVRVTLVGGEVFAAAIHSQCDPAASVDWRQTENPNLPHSCIDLPRPLIDLLQRFMGKMGLAFGCIDLVKTPAGKYVFLEVNPSGQWLWLDDQLDFGISYSVADWLMAA